MRSFIILLTFLFLGVGCGNNTNEEAVQETKSTVLFTFQGTPTIIILGASAKDMSRQWTAFKSLETSFDIMFQSATNEDLLLAVKDLLQKTKDLEVSKFPNEFDNQKIKSRITILRTFLLKVEAGLEGNRDVSEGIQQMVVAYNNVRGQMNIIANNPLDTQLILNEE